MMSVCRHLGVIGILSFVLALLAVAPAFAADIHGISILTATERSGGVVGNNFFEVSILADGLDNARFYDYSTQQWYFTALDPSDGLLRYRENSATIGNLLAAHPTPTMFAFYFDVTPQGAFSDAVIIDYDRLMPSDYLHVTLPSPNQTDVPDNVTVTWDFAGEADYMGKAIVKESTGETVFVEYSAGAAPGTWEPGTLEPNTGYSVILGAWNVVTGNTTYISTLNGDYFTFIGIMNDSNRVTFTTAGSTFGEDVPEPTTLVLMATGLLGGGWWARRRK